LQVIGKIAASKELIDIWVFATASGVATWTGLSVIERHSMKRIKDRASITV
jgi:hypothetical protein